MQKKKITCFSPHITNKADRSRDLTLLQILSSHVEALVPGLCRPSVPQIHIDIGGYKIIHLVTL